jgi:flagellar motor switch protein FliN/FliY
MSKVQSIELDQLDSEPQNKTPVLDNNLNLVKDVTVSLDVRVGSAQMTIEELMNLSKDSVVELSKLTTSPVELLLDQNVVAEGFLVASNDNFGIQISNISE